MWVLVVDGAITAATTVDPQDAAWTRVQLTPRPADTDTGTWSPGVEMVEGVPVQTWTARPWTQYEEQRMSPERLEALRQAGRVATLRSFAQNAMDDNRDFLALLLPTPTQTLTQVQALTRQVQALIRLGLGLLDDTD